jgi:hypothetical protein
MSPPGIGPGSSRCKREGLPLAYGLIEVKEISDF